MNLPEIKAKVTAILSRIDGLPLNLSCCLYSFLGTYYIRRNTKSNRIVFPICGAIKILLNGKNSNNRPLIYTIGQSSLDLLNTSDDLDLSEKSDLHWWICSYDIDRGHSRYIDFMSSSFQRNFKELSIKEGLDFDKLWTHSFPDTIYANSRDMTMKYPFIRYFRSGQLTKFGVEYYNTKFEPFPDMKESDLRSLAEEMYFHGLRLV